MKNNDKARKCVTIFVIIMVTNIIYTLIEGIVIGSSSIYSFLLGSVLYLWLLFSLYKRKNFARITLPILILLGFTTQLIYIFHTTGQNCE